MARTTKISGVKLNEVSFVGKGDNPEAHIVLLKTKKSIILEKGKEYKGKDKAELLLKWVEESGHIQKGDGDAILFADILSDKEIRDKIWSMVWTLEDSISSIMYDEEVTDKKTMIQQTIEQFKDAVTTITKGGSKDMSEQIKKQLEEAQAKIDVLEKEKGALVQEVETLKAKTGENEDGTCKSCGAKMKKEDEIDKSALPEAVRKQLEVLEKENKDNKESIAKMADEALTKECLLKAQEIPAIGAVDEVSGLLKDLAKAGKETVDKVFGLLKAADAKIKAGGLFKEVGGGGETGETALDKLNKEAEAYAKENKVTFAKAFEHIYHTNTELRTAYIAERQ